ncbi:MAG: hypothetical protein H7841_03645 [Magnetospirillum sp. WYHS-4]
MIFLVAIPALAGCQYTGADHPVARKASWLSYLSADDIRAGCRAGAPERWRLVYNAVYQEQVRAYEIEAGAPDGGARLTAKVNTTANLANVDIDPAHPDPFSPWRDKVARTDLRAQDLAAFRTALKDSGVFGPAAVGLELDSDGFYWIVAGCSEGRMVFTGYEWPSPAFLGLRFDKPLFAWDFTGVAVNPPRKTSKFELYGKTQPSPGEDRAFRVRIGEGGLWSLGSRF